MNKYLLGLITVAAATGLTSNAGAAMVQNVASGSVAVVSNGQSGQVFNNLLLSGTDNRSNYMVFDLNQLATQLAGQPVGSATLTITSPGFYSTPDASENFTLWDFTGDVAALSTYGFSSPPSAGAAASIRDDLRSGVSYGSTVISQPASGALAAISIVLNADAISAINAGLGSEAALFAIGGFSDSLAGSGYQYLFTNSNGTGSFGAGNATLSVQPVPLPAAVWLFGSALTGLGVFGRRRVAV